MIKVQMSMEDWQRVLGILAQAPWATANPLIMAIGEQLRQQQPPDDPNARPVARGNSDGRETTEH
jgi:hypothetical protein